MLNSNHVNKLTYLAKQCLNPFELNDKLRSYCKDNHLRYDWSVNINGSITFYSGSTKTTRKLH